MAMMSSIESDIVTVLKSPISLEVTVLVVRAWKAAVVLGLEEILMLDIARVVVLIGSLNVRIRRLSSKFRANEVSMGGVVSEMSVPFSGSFMVIWMTELGLIAKSCIVVLSMAMKTIFVVRIEEFLIRLAAAGASEIITEVPGGLLVVLPAILMN